jgi:hypothetical protein
MYNGSITSNAVTPSVNMKSRIINGAMVIDQRNAGASVSINNTTSYTLDRWEGADSSDGVIAIQQDSSAPAGFTKSLKYTTTTADSSLSATQYAYVAQYIEGLNTADLGFGTANAKTITLSFWVRSSLTGTFGGSISNDGYDRTYPFSYTISAADTWEQKSVTIAGDTSGTWLTTNGVGLRVYFSMGGGSSRLGTANTWASSWYVGSTGSTSVIGTLNATWQVTGVQLEVGSTATSFDYRPYGTELALCQRYYYLAASAPSYIAMGGYYTSTIVIGILGFPTTMRATPTLSSTSGTNYYTIYRNGAGDGFDSLTINAPGVNYSGFENTTNVSGTAGHVGFIDITNAAGRVAFQAEL